MLTQPQTILFPARLLLNDFEQISVEIGFGGGDFLLEQAKNNPKSLIVGFEIKNRRYDNLVRRVGRQQLSNVQLIQADAKISFPKIFAERRIDNIFTLFPDPWPKRKHEGHRLWNKDFLHTCYRFLKPNGKLYLATDDTNYLEQALRVMESLPEFASTDPMVVQTHYARKWSRAGRTLHYRCFQKR